MEPNKNRQIALAMSEYFNLVDQRHDLDTKIAHAKAKVLTLANPGKYDKGTVSRIKKQRIEVSAYVRHSYTVIHRRYRHKRI